MRLLNSLVRHTVGIAAEMLTLKNPYDQHVPPRLISETRDGCGHVVEQTIRATSAADASAHLQGITIQGNRSIVVTKTGTKTYRIAIEDWRTG
jgi:hypothetical protein